ncbi:MAG: glycosyltransferase family 4 protein [Spirosomataceae bacterium]
MNKLDVTFFQRRPHKGFNYSLEAIFTDLRKQLAKEVESSVVIMPAFNGGYLSKLANILYTWWNTGKGVNHVTGEIHFIDLLLPKNKTVLTVLDTGPLVRKKGLALKIVRWLYLEMPLRRAKVITTISGEVKEQLMQNTSCSPEKIRVVYVAIAKHFTFVPRRFNDRKPIILQIGTGPNKNIERLIEALQGISCTLDIVGKLTNEHKELLDSKGIEYQNSVGLTDEEIKQKYEACDMVTFVSTFEGFGMPIVEANAVGRPVITSNISSMPEVAGKAACLVDPFDIDSIRAGILKVIQEPVYRQELIQLGIENKKRFTSEEIASQYLGIYKELMYQ